MSLDFAIFAANSPSSFFSSMTVSYLGLKYYQEFVAVIIQTQVMHPKLPTATLNSLNVTEQTLSTQDRVFLQRVETVSKELDHLENTLHSAVQKSQLNNRLLFEKVQELNGTKFQLQSLENAIFSFGGLAKYHLGSVLQHRQPDEIAEIQTEILGIKKGMQDINFQKDEHYGRIIKEVGEEVKQLQQAVKRQREIRLRNRQMISEKIDEIKFRSEQMLGEEMKKRVENEAEFTMLLEETCIKLQKEFMGGEEACDLTF